MSRRINNVLTWLENSAARLPDKVAFADETESVTYSALVARAKELAAELIRLTPPRKPIAVFGNKTVDCVTAFFACVYAGCYYVPLNPAHPEARRRRILGALGDPVVVVCKGEAAGAELGSRVIDTADARHAFTVDDEEKLKRIAEAHIDVDPLYVIFTSGSTGEPKGIAVAHRSVIDFIEEFAELFGIGEDDVIANQAPFDFDVSVKDIYSTVRSGATMQIVPKKLFSFPTMLVDYLIDRKATTLIWAVSAMCILSGFRAFSYKAPTEIKKVLFSGETMPIKQLNYWIDKLPSATFVNLYGPTEITCNCAYYVLPRGRVDSDAIPIGKPFPNERVVLLADDGREIAEPNIEGEICVVGTAVSLGYYNAPEETARAFNAYPKERAFAQPMYRTGDIGYIGDDGLLYFVGRRDLQVKYMGHRIELGEIERAVAENAAISRAVCVFDGAKQRIYAFYIGDAEPSALAAELRQKLPPFMIPSFSRVDGFPLTENGKVDRRALLGGKHGK